MWALHMILFPICAFSLIYKYYTGTAPNINDPKFSILEPFNTTQIVVEDNYTQLINISNFTFKINPQPCKYYPAGLLLMIIVSSDPKNQEKRMLIRSTWGRKQDSIQIVFLIGETENVTVAQSIKNESMQYGDLVQGNFVDAYRNLTYKHVMGLKWVAHHCPTAKYVLKTDDDILVNIPKMTHFLARELSPWGAKNLITCRLSPMTKVHRSKSKWTVTHEEYPSPFFPPFCEGWAVIYSQDVVQRLLEAAQSTPYFWIDDAHITGVIAERIGVPRTQLSSLVLTKGDLKKWKWFGPEYVKPFLFGPPILSAEQIKEIWSFISA